MSRLRIIRNVTATLAVALVPFMSVAPVHARVVKAVTAGDGLIATSSGQCSGDNVDASTVGWTWTKPTMEISADNGATWSAASSFTLPNSTTKYGVQVCRNVGGAGSSVSAQAYWFIIQPSNTNVDDMGKEVVDAGLQFKVTVPLKTGDTATRMTGYSKVVSFQDTSGTVTAIVKASQVAKVNWGNGWTDFKNRHPECATLTEQTWSQCKIEKADKDLAGTVIQHIEFIATPPTSWQTLSKGVWIGANVNGYQMTLTCATKGTDENSNSSGGNYGGGSYSGSSDGGANKPSGSSSSTTPPSLSVTMSGTPHLRADGVTVNEGNLQAFVPELTARTCFGDGTDTISLATIAQNMTVSRTESSENGGAAVDLTAAAYTATAVTSPVAGLLIDVAKMTFSNPTYKVSSKLAQQLLASYTASGGSTSGNTNSNNSGAYNTQGGLTTTVTTTVTFTAKVKGTKVTLTITLGTAQTVKVYKKVGAKSSLVKTVKGKVGANTVVTPFKKGTTYTLKDSKGKTLKSVKA